MTKPFQCQECGKMLTLGEAKAAEYRGCPKCGGSDVDVAMVLPATMPWGNRAYGPACEAV